MVFESRESSNFRPGGSGRLEKAFVYPYERDHKGVLVLRGDEIVTTYDGQEMKAISLKTPKRTVSFTAVLEQALQLPAGRIKGRNVPKLFERVIDLVVHYNDFNPDKPRLQPIIVIGYGEDKYRYYLFPRLQKGRIIALLKKHSREIETLVGPLALSREDLNMWKRADPNGRDKAWGELMRLGIDLLSDSQTPKGTARFIVRKILSRLPPELVEKTEWPIVQGSDLLSWYKAVLYRHSINIHRDNETAKRQRELERNDPLTLFFVSNPPESDAARRLFATLSLRERNVFTARFLEKKEYVRIVEMLHTTEANARVIYRRVYKSLRELIHIPVDEWKPYDVVREAQELYPDFYKTFLGNVPPHVMQYVQLKYDKDLDSIAIGEKMGISEGAVKSVGHRFRERLSHSLNTYRLQHGIDVRTALVD